MKLLFTCSCALDLCEDPRRHGQLLSTMHAFNICLQMTGETQSKMFGMEEVSESKDVWIAMLNFEPSSGVTVKTIWNSNKFILSVHIC